MYDIWSMYDVYKVQYASSSNDLVSSNKGFERLKIFVKDQPLIILHHLFIGLLGFLVIVHLRGGLGDCVFGFVYLMEFSTPFVSFRGILSLLKLKKTRLYLINGLVMLVTFFFCRVVMFPYVCYIYSQVVGLSFFNAVNDLPKSCKIFIVVMMLPQFYWFYLMLKGAWKAFFPKNIERNFEIQS